METQRYKVRNIDQQAQRQRAIKSKKLRLSENQRSKENKKNGTTERNVDCKDITLSAECCKGIINLSQKGRFKNQQDAADT